MGDVTVASLADQEIAVLRRIAAGAPLREVLERLVEMIEQGAAGAIGSVLFVEGGRVRGGVAPRLPRAYTTAIDGANIGPNAGSCGTAAYTKEPVFAEDIAADPRWVAYRDTAEAFGLRACWSFPILGEAGEVFGTFALYWPAPKPIDAAIVELGEHAARLAAVAFERHRKDEALATSEARARAIVESALDAHVMIDAEGRVVEWSGRAEALFGWRRAAVIGRKLADFLLPEEQRPLHDAGLARYQLTGESTMLGRRVEVEALHEGGRRLPVELAVTAIVDRGERRFSAFISDLTERKAAEAALRENDAALAAIYHDVADVLFQLSVDGNEFRLVAANRAFYAASGLRPENVIGKRVEEVLPPTTRRHALTEYAEAVRTRSRRRWADVVRLPSGEKHGDVTVTPVLGEGGKVVALVGTFHDLTERLELERELRELQRVEMIGRLTAGIAHDFNNVLAVVQLGTGLLERGLDPAALAEQVKEIAEAGRAGSRLTRQLLALSRSQPLEVDAVEVGGVVTNLTGMLRRLLREDVVLHVEVTPGLPAVRASTSQVEQLLVNLVVNAHDALGGRGTIRLRVAPGAGDGVEVSVADDGPGMSAEVKARIFEPFFTTKPPGRGTGLGLAIVRRIVTQAGGTISVESELGAGARFVIELPSSAELPVAAAAAAEAAALADLRTARVLVAEDDPPLRRTLLRVLEQLGHEVRVASNADEARAHVAGGFTPDLLVTDSVMPDASGSALVDELRARMPTVRALFVSGYAAEDDVIARRGQPRTAHLDKPFTLGDLASAVDELLRRP